MSGSTPVLGLTTVVGSDTVDIVSHFSTGGHQKIEDLLTGAASPAGNLSIDFNSASNRTLSLLNSGAGTAKLTVADGITITAGGLTITAGGLTVSAGAVSLPSGSLNASALVDASVTPAKIQNRTRHFTILLLLGGNFTGATQESSSGEHPVVRFSDAGADTADALGLGLVPEDHVPDTQLTFRVRFWMETATSGNVVLELDARVLADAGVLGSLTSLGSSGEVAVAVPGVVETIKEWTFETTTAPSAGDWIALRVVRDGASGSDTASGNLNLIAVVEVEYTADS